MHLIFTAAEAKRLAPIARPLVRSPASFDGTLDAFAEQYVLPNLPTADSVETFHDALSAYASQADPLFLLRALTGTTRSEVFSTREGVRFKATDNAPAWWVHSVLVQGWPIAPRAFADVMATIPAHFFDVPSTCAPTANEAGFHIAHLFDVKDGSTDYANWSRVEVVGRFVRNVHPCNYFLMAKSEWQRWGGDQRVLDFFGTLYRKRYSAVWSEFQKLAMATDRPVSGAPVTVTYTYAPKQLAPSEAGATAPGPRPEHGYQAARDGAHVQYRAARLTFKRDIIEPLADGEAFRVVTPVGVFEMTKEAMYRVFPGVPRSLSYRERGTYHYATLPKSAEQFRVAVENDGELPGVDRV